MHLNKDVVVTHPIHLLMPMSGLGSRFAAAGYTAPKPLIDINGVPMVQRLLQCFPLNWPSFFVMADSHRQTTLPALLDTLRPQNRSYFVPSERLGPSHAALAALAQIPDDAPVFLSYCDYGMVWDASSFERFVSTTNCDVAIVSYRGFHAHYLKPQMYAYSRMVGGRVAEVREKGCFTGDREQEFASAGGYYFRTARLLKEAITAQMAQKRHLNGEFYTSLTIEALLQLRPQTDVRIFEIPYFFQWGTPADVAHFVFWEQTFGHHIAQVEQAGQVAQLLMPMAGHGSRFGAISSLPKPLIPVGEDAMFVAALKTLPRAERTVLVVKQAFAAAAASASQNIMPGPRLVALAETPSGQALSTEAGLKDLRMDQEVVVSSCDHGIVAPAGLWDALRESDQFDAAIMTMTGFPGADDAPCSYAYVATHPNRAAPFADVAHVGVKTPLSSTPSRDPVLVGTFWFRTGKILADAIAALKTADIRVNGELYLDSVFALMLANNQRVCMVPLSGYICWGDPNSLAEALYWQDVFVGRSIASRPRFPKMVTHVAV